MGVTLALPIEYGEKLRNVVAYFAGISQEIHLQEIWLFGSVARGSFSIDSDIDVMLIVAEDSDIPGIRKLADGVDFEGFPEVDVTVRTLNSLQTSDYAFAQLVLKEKIVLWTDKSAIGA